MKKFRAFVLTTVLLCFVLAAASCGKTQETDNGVQTDTAAQQENNGENNPENSGENNQEDSGENNQEDNRKNNQEDNRKNNQEDNRENNQGDNDKKNSGNKGGNAEEDEKNVSDGEIRNFPDDFGPEYDDRILEDASGKTEETTSYVPESISYLAVEQNPEQNVKKDNQSEEKLNELQLTFNADGTFSFAQEPAFYENDAELTITAPEGMKICYTLDGTLPTQESPEYSEPLYFEKKSGDYPDCYTLRACTFDASGNQSKIAARSYLVAEGIKNRFSTLVFFVSGDPAELTEKPDGIFAGNNYKQRGRESERMVFAEAFDKDSENIFSQYAGVRIYGGASRESSIKSMKLFSRKSYDEENKYFKIKSFGTEKLDGSGDVIKKYDKLVLRNCGNDLQFSYIRDELSQTLCKNAGMAVYEAVVPAVAYLNGAYYGLFWLHENYCDKYFKEKFGDAEGEFVVAEGNDRKKSDDEDELVQLLVDDYNEKYDRFSSVDLTDDAVYSELCDYIDVENYLDFFAWNIAINNFDWPNNNFKCYRYISAQDISDSGLAEEGTVLNPSSSAYGEGVFDGRWRFLPHDMDFSYNLYDQNETKPSFNTLKVVLNPNHDRYSPLFSALMERADCRHYFREKTKEYCNGVLSTESIISTYEELHSEREKELDYFYGHLQRLLGKGDWSIWSRKEHYSGYELQIYDFAEKRSACCLQYMEELLPEL